MSARAAVYMNDGAATPVAHQFDPARVQDDAGIQLATWEDRSSGIAVGYPTVTLSMKRPSKTSRTYRVQAKVTLPVLETISNSTVTGILPAPTKAFEMFANIDIVWHERATLQNRKDLKAFLVGLAGQGVITDAVVNTDMVY